MYRFIFVLIVFCAGKCFGVWTVKEVWDCDGKVVEEMWKPKEVEKFLAGRYITYIKFFPNQERCMGDHFEVETEFRNPKPGWLTVEIYEGGKSLAQDNVNIENKLIGRATAVLHSEEKLSVSLILSKTNTDAMP